jgi:hypothetical protein
MTRTPNIHYCQKRDAFITFSQTLRSCITANHCYSDDPCPHAQNFQAHSSKEPSEGLAATPRAAPTLIPYPAE